MKSLGSRVLKIEDIDWSSLKFIQNDNLKEINSEAKAALKKSVIENNFVQPFYVWQDEDVYYCLDGKHRVDVLRELKHQDAISVPDKLPAIFIDCKNKNEAAELVLIYSSFYAKTTQQGLFDFIQMYDINYEDIRNKMHLPEMSMDRYEQKFDISNILDVSSDEDDLSEDIDIIVKQGDIFDINGHRIYCGSFKDKEQVAKLMNGKKARILNCDPPYNLPTNFFSGQHHKDFAEGAGEMTDQQFVDFLSEIMKAGVDNTVDGAIHYIFMDFRHVWHMTEAGREIYGSPQPKQICVWNKDLMANGSFYRAKHELCFVFSNEKSKHLWNSDLIDKGGFYKNNNELCFIFKNGDGAKHLSHLELKNRIRTNVWNYPSATSTANPDRKELKNHPTPKPVAMIADSILDTTNPGDIVIDWFLGSGTALIACEKTGRFCYATEFEPLYVQQIIKRYINFCEKNNIEVNFIHVNGELTLNDFHNEHAELTVN